jgi:hypothetical protein
VTDLNAPPSPWTPAPPDVLADARASVGGIYDRPPIEIPTVDKNWLGIVALVFGLIGGVALALIFGALSLRANRNGRANNRTLAVVGMAAAGGWVLILGLGAATALLTPSEEIYLDDARVGDCYESTLEVTDGLETGFYSFAPCDTATNGIVYFVTSVDSMAGYTSQELDDELFETCISDAAAAGVDLDIAYDYYVEYFVPSEAEWARGNHRLVCGLSADGELNLDVLTDAEPNVAD